MKKEEKKNSGIPLIIIVGVLVALVAGFWWLYNSPKRPGSNRNAASNTPNRQPTPDMSRAPIGAQPPYMLGSPAATVMLEEFADFQCPSCATVHPVVKEIQSTYGSRIRFIFRHFPLQMHDKAYDAAVAAEAAGMQGSDKFWAMHNLLYTNQKSWSADPNYRQVFAGYAQQLGLNIDKFTTDMAGVAAKGRVNADMERGRALNVSSTPTIYINGKSIPYAEMNTNSLRQIIDAEMQASSSKSAAPANSVGPAAAANRANGNTK